MSGDYEDALAHLLSGESDYLLLDSEVARRELQEELAGPNPNTALFREFAAVGVRLHPSRLPLLVSLSEQASEGADSTAPDPSDGVAVCHWCREALPEQDSIHFCPFCGSDLRPSPCRECGEAMEACWQFCASCGAGVRD
jgi:hypothetical protein